MGQRFLVILDRFRILIELGESLSQSKVRRRIFRVVSQCLFELLPCDRQVVLSGVSTSFNQHLVTFKCKGLAQSALGSRIIGVQLYCLTEEVLCAAEVIFLHVKLADAREKNRGLLSR